MCFELELPVLLAWPHDGHLAVSAALAFTTPGVSRLALHGAG